LPAGAEHFDLTTAGLLVWYGLREATLTLAESPARTWTVTAGAHANARAVAVRAGWLGVTRR